MVMEIISRAEAKAKGLKRYFTGKPCKHGHAAERYVASSECCVCKYHSKRTEENIAKRKAYDSKRMKDPDNKKARKIAFDKYRKTEKAKQTRSVYGKRPDRSKYTKSQNTKRRAAKLQRTPMWSDLEAIKDIYLTCPDGFHVDHIIPLQGKTVSGLHVPENLQYLTAEDNLRKSNTY